MASTDGRLVLMYSTYVVMPHTPHALLENLTDDAINVLSSMWRNFRPFPSIWLNFMSHRDVQPCHPPHTAKSAKTFLTVWESGLIVMWPARSYCQSWNEANTHPHCQRNIREKKTITVLNLFFLSILGDIYNN